MHTKFKVITLDIKSFGETCQVLQSIVERSGFKPDCILGIESGGRFVAERLFTTVPHCYTRLRRPSTDRREGMMERGMKSVLRFTPRWICDFLRRMEARHLMKSTAGLSLSPEETEKCLERNAGRVNIPDLSGFRRILVVDDAVDSGVTLAAVMRRVRAEVPDAEIRSAVVTVTTSGPLFTPDYTIYNDNILIRFPWSIDNLRPMTAGEL